MSLGYTWLFFLHITEIQAINNVLLCSLKKKIFLSIRKRRKETTNLTYMWILIECCCYKYNLCTKFIKQKQHYATLKGENKNINKNKQPKHHPFPPPPSPKKKVWVKGYKRMNKDEYEWNVYEYGWVWMNMDEIPEHI